MSLRFGTDGVRGDADTDLTSPLISAFGRAAARVLGNGKPFLIGRDTRASGPRLEAALCAGMEAEGATVTRLGVLPTPALAFCADVDGAPAAMISASHNPWRDNGIKLFAPGGRKLDDDTEAEIESEMQHLAGSPAPDTSQRELLAHDDAAIASYIDHLVGVNGDADVSGMPVVIDCANGAASTVADTLANRLGLRGRLLHTRPNGRDINDGCGSTHPERLQEMVVRDGAAVGLALDGDADRVLAVDEHGTLVDGDQIMVMTALDLHARGMLRNDAIAVTVMSNLGLRRALERAGVGVVETAVGDRNVLAALDEFDLVLGGEQSGHIVFREYARTGDGLLTGLMLLCLMARTGRPLSELAAVMTRFPQVLVSVHTGRRPDLDAAPSIAGAVRAAEARLGDAGRVLVRASGTEPVVRVMVEASTHAIAETEADRLVAVVRSAFSPA